MEKKYQTISTFQFSALFPDDHSCLSFLAKSKWQHGYACSKCRHTRYCKGSRPFERQCTKCRYTESPTAGTLFHKIKFPIQKAFWIVYYLSTGKKGMASTDMSRKLGLRQKTCWLFKQKVMQAMQNEERNILSGLIEIGAFTIMPPIRKTNQDRLSGKRHVLVAIERSKSGIKRILAKFIDRRRSGQVNNFITDHLNKNCCLKICTRLEKLAKNTQIDLRDFEYIHSKKKLFFTRAVRTISSWLYGIHHNVDHLQYYLNEVCYRYNRHQMKGEIFYELITSMVKHAPRTYRMIIDKVPT